MRAILVGDIHLADRPPSIRTESYADDILAKLRFAVQQANELADVLVLLGDVFHIKTPSKTSHRLVQRTADVLAEFRPQHSMDRGPGRVLIVPGNHDMSQDRIESLASQPLGTLALSSNVEILTGWDGATNIFAIPYLQDWTTLPEWFDDTGATSADLLITHAPIFPPGEDPPFDYISAADWAGMMEDAYPHNGVAVAYGHIHDQHGFYQAGTTVPHWFCNNGAISRGSLHEQTVKREPKITLWDSHAEGCPFTSIDVPHRPAAEVFRLEQHHADIARGQRLDEFLGSIADVSLTALSMEEVLTQAATSGLSEQARTELAAIVEQTVHS